MNKKEQDALNSNLDILFGQIESLEESKKAIALKAIEFWRSAKTLEFMGLGPMESMHEYKSAYEKLKELGLNVSGMIVPV